MMRPMSLLLWLVICGEAAPEAFAHPGIGVVVDSKGNVFYTDLRQVWKLSPDGAKSVAVPHVHTHELCLDSDDNLFGEHLWYEGDATGKWGHRVWKLSPDGKLTDVIPAREGFLTQCSFVRDARGNMYWAGDGEGDRENRVCIRRRAPDGSVSILAGGESGREDGVGRAARFTDIRWMAASPEGTLYVIDAGSVRRIAADGTVSTLASGLDENGWHFLTGGRCHHLMGLCPDAQGNVYVANTGTHKVQKVGANGKIHVFARSPAPYSPTGVTVTKSGDVIILECSGSDARVRRVPANGAEGVF